MSLPQNPFSRSPEALLPGLPNFIVLDYILPRIPWHTRPVLKALSSAWRNALLIPAAFCPLTRQSPLDESLVLVHQLSDAACDEYFSRTTIKRYMPPPHALSIYNDRTSAWQQLPPIPAFHPLRILHACGVACVQGKLFVMGGWDPRSDGVSADVYMLDLGGGLWQWEKRRSMHTANSAFFCNSVAGKIYVVGGSSPHDGPAKEPRPEVYDVENDKWELLPSISLSRAFNGLAVAGDQVLAYGSCGADGGELTRFWKVFDPQTTQWTDWDCDLASCSEVLAGDHDLRDGVINKFDAGSKKWIPFAGKVCAKGWHWVRGQKLFFDSTCAHSFFVVSECSKPHAYATICEGDNRFLTLWRGDLDYPSMKVSWQQIELPGSLYLCWEMCCLKN